MTTFVITQTKQWLKRGDTPLARNLFCTIKTIRCIDIPAPRFIYAPLYHAHKMLTGIASAITRVFYWTPLFKSQTQKSGKRLYLYGGMPFISGNLSIFVGSNCRISAHSTFSGRVSGNQQAQLVIGDNVDIGWMTTIACGTRVIIGNNVRIAGKAFFAGYPGHPMNAEQRALGFPELDEQAADIILEDDVWLATGVSVMAGVTIGEGSVIAAGSVVTKNIPSNVLAGGVPAKVIRTISQ